MATRVAIVFCLLLPLLASASEESPPAVTNDSLNGIWEGLVGDWILYRMDIRPRGDSYLVEHFAQDMETLYRLVHREVRGGSVLLRFRKVSGGLPFTPTEVTLRGHGYAGYQGQGELKTTLVQTAGEKGSFPLRLQKGSRVRILARASKQAEKLIPR
jgi:hypothetical protein